MVGDAVAIDISKPKGGRPKPPSGTKLVLRKDRPLNDAPFYGEDDPGEFLGYSVGRLRVPRWMSLQFADAVRDGVDVSLYPDDWVEKLYYVPLATEAPARKVIDVINCFTAIFPCIKLDIDDGCGVGGSSVVLQPVTVDSDGNVKCPPPKKTTYYALASGHADRSMKKITEWTIATQANRSKFETSAIHKRVVTEAVKRKRDRSAIQRRLFEAIVKLPQAFRP